MKEIDMDSLAMLKSFNGKTIRIFKLLGVYEDPELLLEGKVVSLVNSDTDVPEMVVEPVEFSTDGCKSFIVYVQYAHYSSSYDGLVDEVTSILYRLGGTK